MEFLLLVLGVLLVGVQSQLGVKRSTIPKFFGFDSASCNGVCNGEPITSFEVTCEGILESKCVIDGFNVKTVCLGSFKYSVDDEDLVGSYCKGIFFNNYEGADAKGDLFEGGTSCGGTHKLAYTVASKTGIVPNSPVNETCLGNWGNA